MRRAPRKRRKHFVLDGEKYLLFEIAERLGKTVTELLTGQPSPLSMQEFVQWAAFYSVRANNQKRAEERSKR